MWEDEALSVTDYVKSKNKGLPQMTCFPPKVSVKSKKKILTSSDILFIFL